MKYSNHRTTADIEHTAKSCITHHYACDCRELYIRNLEQVASDAEKLLNATRMVPTCYAEVVTLDESLKKTKGDCNVHKGN